MCKKLFIQLHKSKFDHLSSKGSVLFKYYKQPYVFLIERQDKKTPTFTYHFHCLLLIKAIMFCCEIIIVQPPEIRLKVYKKCGIVT